MTRPIDKRALLDAIRVQLEGDRVALTRSQRSTQAGATHEEARPEHAKDTRALESTYLARGLAERVVDLERQLATLGRIDGAPLPAGSPVAVGALVSVEDQEGEGPLRHFFLTPCAGGLVVEVDGETVRTLTPSTPMGQALLGLEEGDEVGLQTRTGVRTFTIEHVV